jgi:hypothetical protein
MLLREVIGDYFENDMLPINTLCGQNANLLCVKVCGTCGSPCASDSSTKRKMSQEVSATKLFILWNFVPNEYELI